MLLVAIALDENWHTRAYKFENKRAKELKKGGMRQRFFLVLFAGFLIIIFEFSWANYGTLGGKWRRIITVGYTKKLLYMYA